MCIHKYERGLLARYNIADNDFPSIDIEKLIELWQQEECLWNISLEGYNKKDLKGNALDRIRQFRPPQ